MPVRIRPTNLGIIYAAAEAGNPYTYLDRKGVTQAYIELTGSYVAMTTQQTGGVDTSTPSLDATIGLTLAVKMEFGQTTEVTIKAQARRADQTADPDAWLDLQLVNQSSGTVAVEQVVSGVGATVSVGLQTASEFTSAGQFRVLAKYTAGGPPDEDDRLTIWCEAA